MTQITDAADIPVEVQGNIHGQVARGQNVVQIGSIHGGVVNIIQQGQVSVRQRAAPVQRRPQLIHGLVNRQKEISTANSALQLAQSVEFHGPAGIGKTALLNFLCHHCPTFPHGLVYLLAYEKQLTDLLEELFDAFYECDIPYKPRHGEVLNYLQNTQALVVVDNVELARERVHELMNAAPNSAFLLASSEQRLGGDGQSMALRGLPPEDALTLLEQELGRQLAPGERAPANELCAVLGGHPLDILRFAAIVRHQSMTVTDAAGHLKSKIAPARAIVAQVYNELDGPEKRILVALAMLGDRPLDVEHITALMEGSDPQPYLGKLQQRKLIQANSPQYRLTGNLADTLRQMVDPTPWFEWYASRFVTWGRQQHSKPDLVFRDADAALKVLEWAVGEARWIEALNLARVVEGPLALGKRWGAWGQVLDWGLQAAQTLQQQPAEAWASHQLGTRLLSLGDTQSARPYLKAALAMREALGDQTGAAVTRHNLDILLTLPMPPGLPLGPPPPGQPPPGQSPLGQPPPGQPPPGQLPPGQAPPVPTPTSGMPCLLKAAAAALAFVVPCGLILLAASLVFNGNGMDLVSPIAAILTPNSTSPTTQTPADTLTPTPADTLTLTPADTLTPTPADTLTPTPADTLTPTPADTFAPTPTNTFTPPPTSTFTPAPTNTFTPTPTNTFTPAPTSTFTPAPTNTFTPLPTDTITPTPSPPDLVVASIESIGPPATDQSGSIIVPVLVVVRNQGGQPAGIFKVAAESTRPNGTFIQPFTVSGETSPWYPDTNSPLAPGNSVTFNGVIALLSSSEGQTISLRAVADSCAGEEFIPEFCRVDESNENNNYSSSISVQLPIISTPTATPTTPPFVLTSFTVKEEPNFDKRVSWQSTGGVPPYSGTIAARYAVESNPYITYKISNATGVLVDDPPLKCSGTFDVIYTINLYDGSGRSSTMSETVQVLWIC